MQPERLAFPQLDFGSGTLSATKSKNSSERRTYRLFVLVKLQADQATLVSSEKLSIGNGKMGTSFQAKNLLPVNNGKALPRGRRQEKLSVFRQHNKLAVGQQKVS